MLISCVTVYICMCMANDDTISSMKRGRLQRGEMNALLVPLVLAAVLLVGAIVFGAWSFNSREDYRLNVEKKIGAAVKVAKQEESIAKDKEHAEADKSPLKSYEGPEAYGSVRVMYPKTWSGYVVDGSTSNKALEGYFHPNIVPGVDDKNAAYALRVEVADQTYSKVVSGMNSLITAKKATAAVFSFSKVPDVVGTRFDGSIISGKPISGAMIVIPLRDKTLKIWTESPQYLADFNTYILPNVTFSP